MPSDRQTEIQAPIPLIDPEGKVRAWACGLCHRVAANVSIGGDRDQARAREADSSREYAARCCVCRRCGIQTSDRYGSMCVACRAVESAEWAAQAEAERPQREAREAAARVAAEQRAREALVDIPALSARDWDDDEEYAAFLMPFVLAELSRVQQERDHLKTALEGSYYEAWQAMRAERDALTQEIATLKTVCPNCAGMMRPEAEASELKGVYCPECRESDAFQDDRIAALTQEIATLRQQIGDVAERLDGLQEGDSRTPDWYHAASIAEEWVRALLQKGQ